MTRLCALATVLVLAACGPATPPPQAPPAPPPTPAPVAKPAPPPDPAPVTDGDVTVEWLHGMQILVKRLPGAELVAARLYVRGGVRNWDAKTAGIERLALSTAAAGGTATMPKDAFVRRLATLGSTVDGFSTDDYGGLAAKSMRQSWRETFALLGDVFLRPALPPAEIELQRQIQLSGLRHELEDPDGRLRLRVTQTFYHGHPYANRAVGTIPNVSRFQARDLAAHLATLRETSRLLLVVVGDVDPAEVLTAARATFGALPRGDYHEAPLKAVTFSQPRLTPFKEKLPTNYIASVFPGPRRADADFPAALVAMSVLREREFEQVRTKRGLSYAPTAFLSASDRLTQGFLYVTAVDPNTTMKVMFDEARRLQTEAVPPKELAGAKSVYLTHYLMAGEGTGGQAGLLARAQLLGGDWRLSRTLPERVRAVTAAQVQEFARRHIRSLQTVVLGDPAKLDRALFTSL